MIQVAAELFCGDVRHGRTRWDRPRPSVEPRRGSSQRTPGEGRGASQNPAFFILAWLASSDASRAALGFAAAGAAAAASVARRAFVMFETFAAMRFFSASSLASFAWARSFSSAFARSWAALSISPFEAFSAAAAASFPA